MRRRLLILSATALGIATWAACGGDDNAGDGAPDAALDVSGSDGAATEGGGNDATATDATTNDAASNDSQSTTDATSTDATSDATDDATNDAPNDAPAEATVDAAVPSGATCKEIHTINASLPSGRYLIDVDGPGGPIPAVMAYCDMTFDGGGWTLLQSYPQWANGPSALTSPPQDAGPVDGGPDAAWMIRPPEPNELGAWSLYMAKALATKSTQVHIRTPFAITADAGVDGGAYITSVLGADGGAGLPILNLRNGLETNAFGDGGTSDWTGPYANNTRLTYTANGCGVNTTPYPSIYWACNNFSGLHILAGGYQIWNYTSPQFGAQHDPFEVYVR